MMSLSRLEKAKEFRKLINADLSATRKLIRVGDLTEEKLLDMISLYENYYTYDNYEVGETFQYPVYYPQGMKEFM